MRTFAKNEMFEIEEFLNRTKMCTYAKMSS